ncbi:hypothetical protein AAMO2058_001413900 [Amorphochlora amoebiformis]
MSSGEPVQGVREVDLREILDDISKSDLISDRTRWRGRYPKCFVGEDFCSYLIETGRVETAEQAVKIGTRMLKDSLIVKVYGGKHYFANSRGFYRIPEPSEPLAPSIAAPTPPIATIPHRQTCLSDESENEDRVAQRKTGPEEAGARCACSPRSPIMEEEINSKLKVGGSAEKERKGGEVASVPESVAGLHSRVVEMEDSVRGLENTLRSANKSLLDLLERQRELSRVHASLIESTSSLKQTLLKLVAVCIVVFLIANIAPEASIGWISTAIIGVSTALIFGSSNASLLQPSKSTGNGSHRVGEETCDTNAGADKFTVKVAPSTDGGTMNASEFESTGSSRESISGRLDRKGVLYLNTSD